MPLLYIFDTPFYSERLKIRLVFYTWYLHIVLCTMYIWNNGTGGTEHESAFLSLYEISTQLTDPEPVFVNILMSLGIYSQPGEIDF